MPVLPAVSFDALSQRHGPRYKWLVLLVVGLGTVSAVLAATGFSVAIPALMAHFQVGQAQAQWVLTGFMAAMTVGMLPTPWLLDRWGFRRLFLGSVALLALCGVAGSLATHYPLVVGLRIVQGAAAGVLQPLGAIAVMRLFPAGEQGRASGVMGFGVVLAPAVAPTLGGLLLDRFSWPAIFLLNVPICVLAGVLGLFLLPAPREVPRRPFDWLGVGLLTAASLVFVEGIASLQHRGLLSPWTLGLLAVLVLLLSAFVLHARRSRHPVIELGLFRHRTFTLGTVVFFAYGFGIYASAYLIPVFLLRALHFSATAAGVVMLPSGLVLALVIPLAGRLADRYSPLKVTLAGLATFCLSSLFLAAVAAHISHPEIIAATVLGRIGLGLVLPALSLATLQPLPPHQLSQSSVVTSYVRQLGGVLGIAATAVFVAWREAGYLAMPDGVARAYGEGFGLVAAVYLLALLAAFGMRAARPRP